MSSYNHITLVGRLTSDPEQRFTQQGTAVTKFSLAVDRQKRQGQDKPEVDFIPCTAWSKLAEVVGKYCTKGKQVLVDGRLQGHSYTTESGDKRKAWEVIVNNLQMLSSKSQGSAASTTDLEGVENLGIRDIGMEDDVPF